MDLDQVPVRSVIDTLVLSRLIRADIEGGHSLEAWGERLGYPKLKFNDFSRWSQEMEDYCIRDVEVTLKLYNTFSKYLTSDKWKGAIELEHHSSIICREMKENGFAFDYQGAQKLYQEIDARLTALDAELQDAFPPRSCLIREITPKATKHGTIHLGDFRWVEDGDLTPFSVGHPFSRIVFEPFNPASPKQVVTRLNEAGWQPTEKTKGHITTERELRHCRDPQARKALEERLKDYAVYGWKVCEENLSTLPSDAPQAAHKLVERLVLAARRSTLTEWFNAYNPETKAIHGSFNHIGAWTHRMSHSAPNMANISTPPPKPKDREPTPLERLKLWIDPQMRTFWQARPNHLLVGVDADGIQLRILAHYMEDEEFIKALVSGKKEDGTDAHSLNKRKLGEVCRSRDDAKTFIYAWVLGAAPPKLADILKCSVRDARDASEDFLEGYPGLKELKTRRIPKDAERGYFIGLDGRAVMCDSEHKMLAGYLQNGEAIVMKKANVLWRQRLTDEGISYRQVNFVHDEWQTELPDDLEVARHAAQIQAHSIAQVGQDLGLRCPLAGSTIGGHGREAIGHNWSETH